jgi:acetyltransferase-like isoleucine patch superfamily enzyme
MTVGQPRQTRSDRTTIGRNPTVRSGTVIYGNVEIGDDLSTGHGVLIREGTEIGDDVLVGTNSVIDGSVTIGSRVSIQTGVYIPPETTIGDDVFIGPGAVLTNDPFPIRTDMGLDGPTVGDHVSIGANATLLPGVEVASGAFVAAGATVTEDVPADTLALGSPARHHDLPETLSGENTLHE